MRSLKGNISKFFAWIMVSIVIVSLAGFGIQDVILGSSGRNIATVGKEKITVNNFLLNVESEILKFSQDNLGLHHFCFRMRSKENIEQFYFLLKKIKANIIRGPMNGNWVKGYYYIVFEDPDGIRLEVNYVPNKGIFEKNAKFNPSGDY